MKPATILRADLRQRFQQLLSGLPEWQTARARRTRMEGTLYNHAIWDEWNAEGSPAETAKDLVDLLERHGRDAMRMVLDGLRSGSGSDRCAEIETLVSHLRAGGEPRKWNGTPYLGLSHFDRQHAPIFFGREDELRGLVAKLACPQGRGFTVVAGDSGSGKSSLVRAGLWARLEPGQIAEMPGSERWLISAMTPARLGSPIVSLRAGLLDAIEKNDRVRDKLDFDWRHEVNALAPDSLAGFSQRLTGPGTDARWLLILDQMEELFNGAVAAAEAGVFLDRLIEAARTPTFQVVATLRADFLHHSMKHPPLLRVLNSEGGRYFLDKPGRLALERMVSGPLTEVELPEHWTLDPDLAPAMAAAAVEHPGGLALMAFALRELHGICAQTRRMDLDTYRSKEFGELSGAIARRADATLAGLGNGAEAVLQRVFVRLVRVNADDAPTRRRAQRSVWPEGSAELRLVDAFVKARLLVAGEAGGEEPVVGVAHEALLREWPKLAAWIGQRRDDFRLADHVRTEAQMWVIGDPQWHRRRPWPQDRIDLYRERLERSGLLEELILEPGAARLLTPERDWILGELEWEETTHQRRRDIGQRLAKIGDARCGVGVKEGLPDILWRSVPGGQVRIEKHGVFDVEPFQIAAFPVTISQFRAFFESGDGFQQKLWWKDLERKDPDGAWDSSLGNHPVIHVSWYDATAFCRWLTKRCGYEVRLPDEWEWQWAAQSARAEFAYPWGVVWEDGGANTRESGIKRTTAVGTYPPGRSLQEVDDLAGNVWEWCRNEHTDPRRIAPSEEPRVLRGGSWGSVLDLARAVDRLSLLPDLRDYDVGFRVVCSSPSAGH